MLSPRSQAKQRKEHYLVQDRAYGYLCVLCGNSAKESGSLGAKKCFPLPELQPLDEHLEKASKSSKASGSGSPRPSPTEALSEVTPKQASMLEELAFLQKQQAKLEELLQLQELEDFERALQEEEEQLQAALRRSELEAEESELNRKSSRPAAPSIEATVAEASEAPPTQAEPDGIFFDPKNELEVPPAAIVEASQADPDEVSVAPNNEVEVPRPTIVEASRADPDEVSVAPKYEVEVPRPAIVKPSQAEPDEAKVVPPVISMGSTVHCFLIAGGCCRLLCHVFSTAIRESVESLIGLHFEALILSTRCLRSHCFSPGRLSQLWKMSLRSCWGHVRGSRYL